MKCAPLAQLVEHLTLNQGVRGSSPRRRIALKLRFQGFFYVQDAEDNLILTDKLLEGVGWICRICNLCPTDIRRISGENEK